MADFPGKGKVAVPKTTPETVQDDVQQVMRLVDFELALPKNVRTGLKINISWQTWYPACSSTPWQIEGVILALHGVGYKDLVDIHNNTIVGDPSQIEILGYDIEQEQSWGFKQEETFASRGQKAIDHGPLKPLEKILLQIPLIPWSYFASNFYHNVFWYPFIGRKRVRTALENP
jgi:hypothetical protein